MSNIIDIPGQDTQLSKAEAAEQRIIKRTKEHPPKALKNIKGEEMGAHFNRMQQFNQEKIRRRKSGFNKAVLTDTDEFIHSIDEYVEFVNRIKLYPSVQGLCLYIDISDSTFYAIENLGDTRSEIIKKYRLYISEFFNQSGLAQSTNPAFSIYYGKSMLGQSDQAPMTVNLNIGQQSSYQPAEIENVVQLTPDDWEGK